MIDIKRTRYVVVRVSDGYLLAGLGKHLWFYNPNDLCADVSLKTYRSEAKARSAIALSNMFGDKEQWGVDYKAVKIEESIKEI